MAKAKTTATTAKAQSTAKAPAKSQATAQKTPEVTETPEVKESPEVKDLTVQDVAEAKPEEFKSFCGFDYDPAQASSCFTACQKDNPEAYAACVENFKAQIERKEKKPSKARRGKNQFGHLIGCQGAKIDDIFTVEKGAHSLEEIMEYAEATRPRVISHLKHLVNTWNVDLRITDDGKFFINGRHGDNTGKKHNGVKVIEEATPEDKKETSAA